MLNKNISTCKFEPSFSARSSDLKAAEKILRRINSCFPAVSATSGNRRAELTLGVKKGEVGVHITNARLNLLRRITRHAQSDIEYVSKKIESIKHFNVMNCLENSEMSYLIAKVNKFENPRCGCLYLQIDDGAKTIKDLDHAILLLDCKLPKDKVSIHKLYIENPNENSIFVPKKKTIVVDSYLGIVDYWDNVVLKWKGLFKQLLEIDDENVVFKVALRDELLSSSDDINAIKNKYPFLDFKKPNSNYIETLDFSEGDKLMDVVSKKYCLYRPVQANSGSIYKFVNFLKKIFGL